MFSLQNQFTLTLRETTIYCYFLPMLHIKNKLKSIFSLENQFTLTLRAITNDYYFLHMLHIKNIFLN